MLTKSEWRDLPLDVKFDLIFDHLYGGNGKFTPPTMKEVRAYCEEIETDINPVVFWNHYEANNWYRGKTKIKNWKAAVRTWANNK